MAGPPTPLSRTIRPRALARYRALLDDLDDQIVTILAERFAVIAWIAELKARTGQPVRDPAREQAMLERLSASAAQRGAPPAVVVRVFTEIIAGSRAQQRRLRREPSIGTPTPPHPVPR